MSLTTLSLLIEANIDSHTAVFELAHRPNLDNGDPAAHARAMRSNDFIGTLHQLNEAHGLNAAPYGPQDQNHLINTISSARTAYYELTNAAALEGDIAAEADYGAYRDILAAIAVHGTTLN